MLSSKSLEGESRCRSRLSSSKSHCRTLLHSRERAGVFGSQVPSNRQREPPSGAESSGSKLADREVIKKLVKERATVARSVLNPERRRDLNVRKSTRVAKQKGMMYGRSCRLRNMLPKLQQERQEQSLCQPFSWATCKGCSCTKKSEDPEELFQKLVNEATLMEHDNPPADEIEIRPAEEGTLQWPELKSLKRVELGSFIMCDAPAKRQSKTSKGVKMSPERPKESTSSHEMADSGICIFVSMPDGSTVTLKDISPQCTVEELPVLLRCVERESASRVSMSSVVKDARTSGGRLRLVYSSKTLQPQRKIEDYDIQDGATLFALLPLLGGAYLGPEFRPEQNERPLKKWPPLTEREQSTIRRLCSVKNSPQKPKKSFANDFKLRHKRDNQTRMMTLKSWVLNGCREGRAFFGQWNHVEGAQYCSIFDDGVDRWKLLKPNSQRSNTHTVHAYSVPPKQPPRSLVVPKSLPEPNAAPGPVSFVLGKLPEELPKAPPKKPNRLSSNTSKQSREFYDTEAEALEEAATNLKKLSGLYKNVRSCFQAAKDEYDAYREIYERNAREIYSCDPDNVDESYDRYNARRDRLKVKWSTYRWDREECKKYGRLFPPLDEIVENMLEHMDNIDPKFESLGFEADNSYSNFVEAKAALELSRREANDALKAFNMAMKKAQLAAVSREIYEMTDEGIFFAPKPDQRNENGTELEWKVLAVEWRTNSTELAVWFYDKDACIENDTAERVLNEARKDISKAAEYDELKVLSSKDFKTWIQRSK